MKKKIMLSLAAVAMVGTLAVGGTLAWFTDTETATNVVTLGNVDIRWNENGTPIVGEETGLDFGANKVPGDSFDKNAKIENVGANLAYVRATVEYKIADGDLVNTLSTNAEGELEYVLPEDYTIEIKAGDVYTWKPYNGYYYYLVPVTSATPTDELVGKVSIKTTAGNEVAGQKFEVVLNAEAIQSDNLFGPNEAVTVENLAEKFGEAVDAQTNKVPNYDAEKNGVVQQ